MMKSMEVSLKHATALNRDRGETSSSNTSISGSKNDQPFISHPQTEKFRPLYRQVSALLPNLINRNEHYRSESLFPSLSVLLPRMSDSYTRAGSLQILAAGAPILATIAAGFTTGFSAIFLPQLQSSASEIRTTSEEASWIASLAAFGM
jgi:hypothetical protein